MKLFEKNEKKDTIINIENDDLKDAKLSSIDFTDETIKKRAFINVLGARLAMKMLFSQKIEANNLYSLYTIHNVIQDLDIADIYYQGIKMDVRLVFNRDEIFIPKSHFELNLLPDLYLVLALKEDFSAAEFLGFFEPKILNTQNQNKDFYFHEYDRLTSPKELKKFLSGFISERSFEISEIDISKEEELFLALSDKEISEDAKKILFSQLSNSLALREKMVEFENFELLSKEAAKNGGMFKDNTLEIIGTQQLFDGEGADASPAEIKADIHEEVLTDLLDEELNPITQDNENEEDSAEDDDDFFAELASFDFELENKDKKDKDNQDSDLTGIAVGGALVGGAIAGVAAASIVKKTDLAESVLDTLAEGVEFTGGVLENAFDFESSETSEIQGEITKESQINTDEIIEFSDFKNNLLDENDLELTGLNNFADVGDSTINLEIEEAEDLNIAEKVIFEKVSELEELDFSDIQNNDEESEVSSKNGNETQDNAISFDDVLEQDQKQEQIVDKADAEYSADSDKILQQLRDLESNEEAIEVQDNFDEDLKQDAENVEIQENSDEIISQVDEFLNNTELTDEQKALLEDTLRDNNQSTEYIQDAFLEDDEDNNYNKNALQTEESNFSEEEDRNIPEDKDVLQVLFTGSKREDMPDEVSQTDKGFNFAIPKDKRKLVVASVASVILASAVIGTGIINSKNRNVQLTNNITSTSVTTEQQMPNNFTDNAGSTQQNLNQVTGSLSQESIPGEGQQVQPNRDMSKAVSDAFSSEPVNASISKVAWEVPEDLAYNDSFRRYLQLAGKNIKLNMQNNLLLATEMAYSNKVIIDLEINTDGSLKTEDMAVSSGSKQIDKIVLQSVKETLSYLKMPSSELGANYVKVTLIINF